MIRKISLSTRCGDSLREVGRHATPAASIIGEALAARDRPSPDNPARWR
jgi:hypothetical protein